MTRDDYDAAWDTAHAISQNLAWSMPARDKLERGGIVGVAELFDVLLPARLHPRGGSGFDWHFQEQFGFRLRNVRPLRFLPCKGALGFWGNFEIRDGRAVQL